ncbi:matrix-remodeling-associated protein 5 [Pholidichthys leucotaenia]
MAPVDLLLLLLPLAAAAAPCPRSCSCPQPSELHCPFRSLTSVPAAASAHVQRINLGFNRIRTLADESLAGFNRLELLMLHGNDIYSLPNGVFKDLTSLQMLKMSYNKLKEIKRQTLQGLWSVARLYLDHNQLEFIHPDAFQGLTSLRFLQLEGNQLQQLHPATFATFTVFGQFHVSTLRNLYLSENGLMSLPPRLVETMPQLENLYLHGNPWTCDCNMRWISDWHKSSPGVLKCKKNNTLPGGQLCPVCSSPRNLQRTELLAVEDLVCSIPAITSPHRAATRDNAESEILSPQDFKEALGNISMGLSDEHGNEVDLECSIELRELAKINWEQISRHHLAFNMTLSVDLECPVDRGKYEKLWRLIAYYSSVPAHLQRGIILTQEPHLTYVYKQDSEMDALYYTGVKANIMAQPEWLMQTSIDLHLNRFQSTAKMVKLILKADLSETVEAELVRRQRSWVMTESKNTMRKGFTAILGRPSQMFCNVHGSGQPDIQWVLPDGSKFEAPYTSPDNRLFLSSDGSFIIKSVSHADTGIYYCIARVHGDVTVLPLNLAVQESSSPPPGEDTSIPTTERFTGDSIFLPCSTSGSAGAEISWILPSTNIVSFHANSSRALVLPNGTLHIPQTQLIDSGFYKCVAMNQYGVDTLVTKVVVRRKGLVRPLKKFLARPQSASGVNTQIEIPTEDAEEASGDNSVSQDEAAMSHLDPSRKRIPGSVDSGRRGIHPSRNIWRRPQVLHKPTGSRFEGRKSTAESRKRINMSKNKIDPKKWADILAKIRERKAQNTVTALPVQHTAEIKVTQQTIPSQATEESSHGVPVQEKESQDYFTTTHTPEQRTEMKNDKHSTQSLGTQVASNDDTSHNAHINSNSHHAYSVHATAEPHITQIIYSPEHAIHDANLDLHNSSNREFFLPQTTSVPIHIDTFWKLSTNTAHSTFSLQENQNTNSDVNGDTTADQSNASERTENAARQNIASSSNDREPFSMGTQIIPAVSPTESATSRGNGKYFSEAVTAVQLHMQWKGTAHADIQAEAMLKTASSTTTLVPTTVKWTKVKEQPLLYPKKHNSRRRNGERRKQPNRRKQKLNKPSPFIGSTPINTLLTTVKSAASTQLKIESIEVTTASASTTVPFTSSQGASSGRLSHKENTVSSHDHEEATKSSSMPASSSKTKNNHGAQAKPPLKSTSSAPAFPIASPAVDHRKTTSQTAVGILEIASSPEYLYIPTSTTDPRIADRLFQPSKPPEATQRPGVTRDLGSLQRSDSSPGEFLSTSQVEADGEENHSGHQHTPTKISEEMLLKEVDFPPMPSLSSASFTEEVMKTTMGHNSSGFTVPPQLLSEERFTDSPITSPIETLSSVPSSMTDPLMPTTIFSQPKTSTTVSKMDTSLRAISQEVPRVMVNLSQDQQFTATMTTSALNLHLTTQSPDLKLVSTGPTFPSMLSSNDTITQIPTSVSSSPTRETSTQGISSKTQLPGRGLIPRGKPRILQSFFQTLTVKAETDAQLPCEAEGKPMPFLSWTKVTTGASIAQNTRMQRFEVHQNGTLIIRNTQPMDKGQYLCTVQNQYGTDKMVVNLEILSQHPLVLQPKHSDISVHVGENVQLECKAEGHPRPRVTWVLPNNAHMTAASVGLPSGQRIAILDNGTLKISQASYLDRGIYKCIGSNAAGADTVSVHLHVTALPPVIRQVQHENTTLPQGSNAYIHCSATGAPPPVIHWITPNGTQLISSQLLNVGNLIVFPNGTLYIQGVGPGNAGRYECSASNIVASSRRTVIVTTRRPPLSTKASITSSSPQRTNVIYGSKLMLNCVAAGEPEPRVIWRTPSKKLVDAQYSFDHRIKVFLNGTISISSVTDKDSGDYLCVARNRMGDDYVILRVNVLTRPAKIIQKPQRSSQEVVYGGNLKVDCVASGLPNPEISWALPDGTMVNPVKQREGITLGRSRRYVVFDNGTLYFNEVGMPEEGDYTCYAENQLGKDEMKVSVKVKIANSPPKIRNKDQRTVRVFYGETAALRCSAKAEPAPVITWISPMNRVISPALEKYQILDDGTLVVQKAQRFDGGNYTCKVTNSAGQDHKTTRLEVLVTPPVINGSRGTTDTIKVTAVQDEPKLLDCLALGKPKPRIMWVLPGNVILPAPYYSNRMTVHQNGTLEIRSPKKKDSGQLVCIARNEGGEVRLVVNLDVSVSFKGPQITAPKTQTLSLTVGNSLTLNCSFEGPTPLPVTWILPDGTLLLTGARVSKFFHRSDGSLIISNPTVAEAGIYRCQEQNSRGVVEHTINLSPGKKPRITNRYSSPISIMNGENLLLHCQTAGEPHSLAWTLPSGGVLNRPQRAGRYAVLPNGTLAIQQASVYDRGPYVCRAANEHGSSLLPVSVIVTAYPPRITSAPPSVTYAKRGVAVQLNCVAKGMPKVEVAWETPDKVRLVAGAQPRLFGNKYIHPQGSLIIQNPTQRDTGIYRCTARNAIGIDSKATFVNVF